MIEIYLIKRIIGLVLLCFLVVLLLFSSISTLFTITILISIFIFTIWIAISNHFESKDKLSKKGEINISRRKFLYYSAITSAAILIAVNLPYIQTQSENILYNGNFTLGFEGWELPQPNIFTWKINKDYTYNGLPSLEVQTDQGYIHSLFWSWISSNLIKVEFDHEYKITTHMAATNVTQSAIVIQPFDKNGKQMNYQLTQIPSGINGTFDFKEFETTMAIPYGVEYIKFYLLAGLAYKTGSPGKTYFSDLSITKVSNFL